MYSRRAEGKNDPGLYQAGVCYQNKQTMLVQNRALVRPLLEYGSQFWSPIRHICIEHLGKNVGLSNQFGPLDSPQRVSEETS